MKPLTIEQEFQAMMEAAFKGRLETVPLEQVTEMKLAFMGGAMIGAKKIEAIYLSNKMPPIINKWKEDYFDEITKSFHETNQTRYKQSSGISLN